jgi:hypothetical protein
MPNNSRKDEKQTEEEKKSFHIEAVRQMLTLSTAGFGLVAALAWNSLIQEFVNVYIKRWFPQDAKIVSLAIYAIIITLIAVAVTLQLSRLLKKLEEERDLSETLGSFIPDKIKKSN